MDDEPLDDAGVGNQGGQDAGLVYCVVFKQILAPPCREHIVEEILDVFISRMVAQGHCQQSR